MRRGFAVFLAVATAVLAGCHTMPMQNKRLEHFSPDAGYRFGNIAPGENNSNSLFVMLTFSGGGTRAAAFAYGVLEKLRDTPIVWEGKSRRLLDEVDAISSVSGGSLTSAYYAAFGDRIFEDFAEKVLYRDIQGTLIKRVLLSLPNYVRLASPFYGRTDLMANEFDRDIFEGMTFGDLVRKNRRPFLIINSTDVTLGRRFEFTQRKFDLLYSDLGSYPIARAVAASAAYPGLLTPITLRNYAKGPDYQPPAWIADEMKRRNVTTYGYSLARTEQSYIEPGRPYIHLTDGGVSDNLGILPAMQFLSGAVPNESIQNATQTGAAKKVVIIMVDAECAGKTDWDSQEGVLDVFKVLYAAGVGPMGNFSQTEIEFLRSRIRELTERQRIRKQITETLGKETLEAKFPELKGPDVDYCFIPVAFDLAADEDDRTYLNDIPTAFRLSREQVDKLREAAGEILDAHPDFQGLVKGLR